MRRGWVLLIVSMLVALMAIGFGLAGRVDVTAADSGGWYAKHLHDMGGPTHKCLECHDGIRAPEPPPLKGRYAHMGGPNHECTDCHNGVKAPLLPLPEGAKSCGDCHPE